MAAGEGLGSLELHPCMDGSSQRLPESMPASCSGNGMGHGTGAGTVGGTTAKYNDDSAPSRGGGGGGWVRTWPSVGHPPSVGKRVADGDAFGRIRLPTPWLRRRVAAAGHRRGRCRRRERVSREVLGRLIGLVHGWIERDGLVKTRRLAPPP